MSQEEIQIPKGWELKKLGETFEESDQKWLPNTKSEMINYVGLENIESNTGILVNFTPTQSSKIKSSKTIFTKKAILYGKLRPYLNKVLLPSFDGVCSTDILSLTPKSNVDRIFLAYFLRSSHVLSITKKSMQGTKMPRTKIQVLREIQLSIPSLDTQKKIVQKLEPILDQLEEKKQKILSLIEQNKVRIKFFEKNWWSFLLDNEIKNHPQSKEWKLEKLSSVCDVITDGAHKTPTYVKDGIPFLRVLDIKNKNINWNAVKRIPKNEHEELIKRTKPEFQDILYSKNGTIGRSIVVEWKNEFSIFVSLALLKPKKEILNPYFLKIFLDSNDAMSQATKRSKTATVTNLHLEEIRDILIPLPLPQIQKQIVQNIKNIEGKFKEQKNQFENIKQNYELKIKYINHIQSSILDSAFSGKLVN
jgi:restriction endonuclease S subunit